MAAVEGCSTEYESNAVARALRQNHGEDIADIWVFGCQVALRVSDLMKLKYSDYRYRDKTFVVREKKTEKGRIIRLNSKAISVLERRSSKYPTDTYLFQSRGSNRTKNKVQPYHRNTILKAFKAAGAPFGLKLGSHSMRKSKATILIKEHGFAIEQVQALLGHSSVKVTRAYLTINAREIDEMYMVEV